MFELYARLRGILVSDAKLELIDLLAESAVQPRTVCGQKVMQ